MSEKRFKKIMDGFKFAAPAGQERPWFTEYEPVKAALDARFGPGAGAAASARSHGSYGAARQVRLCGIASKGTVFQSCVHL